MPEMRLTAIGVVKNGLDQPPTPRDAWKNVVSEIVIDSSLTEALDGLEEFSHSVVLWWMHRLSENEMPLKVHPGRRPETPLIGLFAARTPNCPNPLGLTTVRLLERHGNVLRVEGLDALDGSPVIDIKPYVPGYDAVTVARVPGWIAN